MALFKRFPAFLSARSAGRLAGTRLALLGLAVAIAGVVSTSSTIRAEDELERIPMHFALARSADHGNCTGDCVEWIVAQGRIMPNSPQQLDTVMRSLGPRRPPLIIHSLGGNVQAALLLGEKIRRYGLPVIITKTDLKPCAEDAQGLCPAPTDAIAAIRTTPSQGVCVSSCAYMMLGGTTRTVPAGARVAVHQFFQTEDGKSLKLKKKTYTAAEFGSSQYLTAELAKYLAHMGVGMGLLEVASNTPPVTVHVLTQAELQRYRVSCDAECARQALAIEQSDGPIVLPAPNLAPDPEPKSAGTARDQEDVHKVSANVRLTGQRTAAQANLTIACTPGGDRIAYELSVSVGPRATLQPKYFQLSSDTKSIVLIGDELPSASGDRGATFNATTPLASLGDLVRGDELIARFGEINGQPVSASFPAAGLAGALAQWPAECFKPGSAPPIIAAVHVRTASGWTKVERHGLLAAAIAVTLKNDRTNATGGLLLGCDATGGKVQTHYELNIDTNPRMKVDPKYFELVANKRFLVAISDQPNILPNSDHQTLTIDKPLSDLANLFEDDTLTVNFGSVNGHPVSADLATKDLRPLLAAWPQACTRAVEAKPDTSAPARQLVRVSAGAATPPAPLPGLRPSGSYGYWTAFNQSILHYVASRIEPKDAGPVGGLNIYLACEVSKGGRRLRFDASAAPNSGIEAGSVELLADGATLIEKTKASPIGNQRDGPVFSNHTALGAVAAVMNSSRLTLRLNVPGEPPMDLNIPKVGLGDALNTWPADCLQSIEAAP